MNANERKKKLIWICSVASFLVIALCWCIVWAITGKAPAVYEICLIKAGTCQIHWILPFAVPRVFDSLLGPIFCIILISLLFNAKIRKDADLLPKLILGLNTGLVGGLVLWLSLGKLCGLCPELVGGMVFELIFLELDTGQNEGPAARMIFGLGFGLGFGLVFGLVFGIGAVLVFVFGFGLVFGLTYAITLVKSIFQAIY